MVEAVLGAEVVEVVDWVVDTEEALDAREGVTLILSDDGEGVERDVEGILSGTETGEEDSWGKRGILLMLTSSSSDGFLSGDDEDGGTEQQTPKRNPSAQVPNLLPSCLVHSYENIQVPSSLVVGL